MIPEAVLRELHAAPRTFRTVGGALRFWVAEVTRRQRVGAFLDAFATPVSRAHLEQREATFARIVACLAPRAPEDMDSDRKLTPRRICNLLAWYESAEQQPRGMHEGAKRTRNQIRRRMANRGLLEGS